MKAKLTLSISPEVIRKARRISKKQRKSVSRLFEELIEHHERMKSPYPEKSIVDQIAGTLQDPGISYDEMKAEYRNSKQRKGS